MSGLGCGAYILAVLLTLGVLSCGCALASLVHQATDYERDRCPAVEYNGPASYGDGPELDTDAPDLGAVEWPNSTDVEIWRDRVRALERRVTILEEKVSSIIPSGL